MTTPDTRIDELCNDTADGMTGGLPFLSSSYDSRLGRWFGGYFVDLKTKGSTQRDGAPDMWKSGPLEGQQKVDLLFVLWCPDEPRDAQNPLDNGLRILSITKHYSHVETSMWGALLKAWEDAGKRHGIEIKGPRRGARIMMLHERTESAEEVTARKGTNRAKIWRADYQLPTPQIVAHLDSLAPAGTPTQLTQPSSNGQSVPATTAAPALPPPPAPTSVPAPQQPGYAPQGPLPGHQYAPAPAAATLPPQSPYQGQPAAPQPPEQNPFGPVPPGTPAAVQQAAAQVATAHQPPQPQGPPVSPYQ